MNFEAPKWQHDSIYEIIEAAIGIGADGVNVQTEDAQGCFCTVCTFQKEYDAKAYASVIAWYCGKEDLTDYLYG